MVTIDLGGDGHTANDPSPDDDTGTNELQNHPVVNEASSIPGAVRGGFSTKVMGVLDSAPDTTYVLEFYASTACAVNDFGPSERFLGSIEITTDENGHGDYDAVLAGSTAVGEVVVGSATDPLGNTSELSSCSNVTLGSADIFADGFESGDTSAWSATVE